MEHFNIVDRLVQRYGYFVLVHAWFNYEYDFEESNETSDTLADMLRYVGYTEPIENFEKLLTDWTMNAISKNMPLALENDAALETGWRAMELVGEIFDLNSAQQLGVVLYEKLGLNPVTKTSTGEYATDDETLEKLIDKHPIITAILEYREAIQYTKVKSIVLNAEIVRAILSGRKTVTRLLIKPQPEGKVRHYTGYKTDYWAEEKDTPTGICSSKMEQPCQPGDILYVSDTYAKLFYIDPDSYTLTDQPMYYYAADGTPNITIVGAAGFKEDDHIPKEVSRTFLKIKSVSAQRLQDFLCCREEILKEGIPFESYAAAKKYFKVHWDGPVSKKPEDLPIYGFDANPWVWAIEYEKIV